MNKTEKILDLLNKIHSSHPEFYISKIWIYKTNPVIDLEYKNVRFGFDITLDTENVEVILSWRKGFVHFNNILSIREVINFDLFSIESFLIQSITKVLEMIDSHYCISPSYEKDQLRFSNVNVTFENDDYQNYCSEIDVISLNDLKIKSIAFLCENLELHSKTPDCKVFFKHDDKLNNWQIISSSDSKNIKPFTLSSSCFGVAYRFCFPNNEWSEFVFSDSEQDDIIKNQEFIGFQYFIYHNEKEKIIKLDKANDFLKYCLNNSFYLDDKVTQIKHVYRSRWEWLDKKSKSLNNAYILPLKNTEEGLQGGVLNSDKMFVECHTRSKRSELIVNNSFTCLAGYEFQDEDIEYIDEDVVFLGITNPYFFHVFLDVLTRMWFIFSEEYKNYKLVFLTNPCFDEDFTLIKELFELLDIDWGKVIFVNKPTQFRSVIVPQESIYYNHSYSNLYEEFIDEIIKKSLEKTKISEFPERIYFTRRTPKEYAVKSCSKTVVLYNDEFLDELFAFNGYKVLPPVSLSFADKIALVHNSKELVVTSGTPFSYGFFMKNNSKLTVLNRIENLYYTPLYFCAEFKCKNVTYVNTSVNLTPTNHWLGCSSFYPTDDFLNYCMDNQLVVTRNILNIDKHKFVYDSLINFINYINSNSKYAKQKLYKNAKFLDFIQLLDKQINKLR